MAHQRTELEDAVDRLYAAPYEAFTETRDRLAKEAKAAGKAELAVALKKERRPPVTAWSLNVLARRAPERVGALLESGHRLRHAQREAVQGHGGDALREATAAQRALLGELTQAAAAVLREAGTSGSADQLDRIEGTLLAAANGAEEHGHLLRHGRLERDLPRPGFGDFAGLEPSAAVFAPAPPPPRPQPPRLKLVPREAEEDPEARRRREEEAQQRERERQKQEARLRLEQRIQGARREVAELSQKVEQARQAVLAAEAAQLEAVERARRARDERNAAEAALARAERELREAELEETATR